MRNQRRMTPWKAMEYCSENRCREIRDFQSGEPRDFRSGDRHIRSFTQEGHIEREISSTAFASPNCMVNPNFMFLAFSMAALLWCADASSEIQALHSFRKNLHDPLGALNGWDLETPSAPCDWRGVICINGRVHELRLPRLRLSGQLSESLGELLQLRSLSLRSNAFSGIIPTSLSQCSLLRAVYFQNNSFSGNLSPELVNLTNLQVLNVANNLLSGRISGNYLPSRIRFLDLSSNAFTGDIPANLSSVLELIDLSFNRFSGEIPETIGGLQQLKILYIDSNKLYGTLPSAISNCSSLIQLSAMENALGGLLPASLGKIPQLAVLSLSHNNLSGSISMSIFNPSMRIVRLGFNAFTSVVAPQNASLVLEVLELQQNRLRGVFPPLTNFSTLTVLDISENLLTGPLPADLSALLKLREFKVAGNSFSGELFAGIGKCKALEYLDLEGNRLTGHIPASLGELRNLKWLFLGRNRFSGSIPPVFGNFSNLETLNLGGNVLIGSIPVELMRLGNLSTLDLSFNRFSGEVPHNIGELRNLRVLNLSGSGFSGKFPANIGELTKLTELDLSKQYLSGVLPSELFGLPNLQVVALEENKLSGEIPEGFSSLHGLRYLNLTANGFSGKIPPTYGYLGSLAVLSLSGNNISGSIPINICRCLNLKVLELRSNLLKGEVPNEISGLSNLEVLDLGQNSLTGRILGELYQCSLLRNLLLDSNKFSGQIPSSLSKLSNLESLNVSKNNLEGEIPPSLGFKFNDPSHYAMNMNLCGKPLSKRCQDVIKKKRNRVILLLCAAIAGFLFLSLCCCAYIFSLLRWRERLRGAGRNGKSKSPGEKKLSPASSGAESAGESKLVIFNGRITYAETVEATRKFDEENVLSRGKFGIVFKASYQDGTILSICRLHGAFINDVTFRREAEALGRIKHRNLTVLRGYYIGSSPDTRLLVFDYMPNGNLATLLQEASRHGGHILNWPMRHLIALGIARGLAHLHSESIVHGDIKPSNVQFDADFEAHVSDFGIGKLAKTMEASSSSLGCSEYLSPEVRVSGRATKEGDVYGFGIVVLEILTGKKPAIFTAEEEDEDIVKWVKRQLQTGDVSELLEPGLVELDPESSEWEEFLLGIKVGLLCTAPDPMDRPSMADAVFMLEGCRVGPARSSSIDPTSLASPV